MVVDGRKLIRSKKKGNRRIKQELDGKRTKKGSRKVTNIDNDTVAPPHKYVRETTEILVLENVFDH